METAAMPQPEARSETPAYEPTTDFTRSSAKLDELRALVHAADLPPDARYAIICAAIDYGTLRADESIAVMEAHWQRSIDRLRAA